LRTSSLFRKNNWAFAYKHLLILAVFFSVRLYETFSISLNSGVAVSICGTKFQPEVYNWYHYYQWATAFSDKREALSRGNRHCYCL